MEREVLHLPYYHGLLPREDMKTMLKHNGDFLLRMSEPSQPGERAVIVSIMCHEDREDTGIKHFIVRRLAGKFLIEKYSFETIGAMIEYHLARNDPLTNRDHDAVLKNAVGRQGWELNHNDIEVTKKLGEGAYGEVSMGKLKTKGGKVVNVAIKLAKLDALTKEQIKEIMREARLMRSFDHPHVVKFYGVAAGTEPLMMVMELVDCGALDSYLSKNPDLPGSKRMEMCTQAAWGVEYLHNTRVVIHRDLAARNCLYGEGKVKISDFGLTREGTSYQMDPNKRVPIRWLAPEVLKTAMYSQKTDSWAFGIMCWEIFAGQEPYPGMMVAEVNMQLLRNQYRMTFTENTPPEMAMFISQKCWTESPNNRANLAEICHKLEQLTGLTRPPITPHSVISDQQTAMRSKKFKSKKKKS